MAPGPGGRLHVQRGNDGRRVREVDDAVVDPIDVAAEEQLSALAQLGAAGQRRCCRGANQAQVAAQLQARQGVRAAALEHLRVLNPDTLEPVPADGVTAGEIMLRGNTVMKGYLKNPGATAKAFAGGWFHTGDIAVLHPDGYVQITDRSKDVIISGGENISSLEVEDVLYRHPAVLAAAVVAMPDEKWGETPCAFVTLKPGAVGGVDEAGIIQWCRDHLAGFKVPKRVVFGPLPKTSTGKIQKFVLRDRARA